MAEMAQFDFQKGSAGAGLAGQLAYLPIGLRLGPCSGNFTALLDTGASVNVLPFDAGLQLGANWEQQPTTVQLSGNLARAAAKVILLEATVAHFAPVRLVFAWTQLNSVPAILGQMNFFLEFDVCFFGSQSRFEVKRKQSPDF